MRMIILWLGLLASGSLLALELPADWRLPTAKELVTEPPRDDSPLRYAQVESDFNGDGKLDRAYLLKSVHYPGEGLLVRLSSPAGYVWQLLDRVEWGEEYASAGLKMRIELAQVGSYKTACALGYWQCTSDEPDMLELMHAGIYQDRFDGAIAIWFWDHPRQQFKQVWLGVSDH